MTASTTNKTSSLSSNHNDRNTLMETMKQQTQVNGVVSSQSTVIVDEGETLFGNDHLQQQEQQQQPVNEFTFVETAQTFPTNINSIQFLQSNALTNQSLQLYWMMPMMVIQNSSSASSLESMTGAVVQDSPSLKRKLSELETSRSAPASFLPTTSEAHLTSQPPRSKMRRLRKPQKTITLPPISTSQPSSASSISKPTMSCNGLPPLVVSVAESTSQRLATPPPLFSSCSTPEKFSTLLDQCFSESDASQIRGQENDDIFLKEEELSASFAGCESTDCCHSSNTMTSSSSSSCSSFSPSSSTSEETTTDLFEMSTTVLGEEEYSMKDSACCDTAMTADLSLMMEGFTPTSSALLEDNFFSSLGCETSAASTIATTIQSQTTQTSTTFFTPAGVNGVGTIALFPIQTEVTSRHVGNGTETTVHQQAKNVIIPPPLFLGNNSNAANTRNSSANTEPAVVKKSLRRISRNKQKLNVPTEESTKSATHQEAPSTTTPSNAHECKQENTTTKDQKAPSPLPINTNGDVKSTTSKRYKSPASNSQKSKSRADSTTSSSSTVFTFCDGGYSIPSGKKASQNSSTCNNFASEKNNSNSSAGWKFHQFDRQKQPVRDSSGFTYHFYQPHSKEKIDHHEH
ncbi:hypothetical protein C9374_006457 [Naegleria lovaniensis]|uniref:Uncharacterized protein n=1 Tax=Naegleria lovaniensis TaxID=51637 RepID=A0AA88KJ63_NAELO|nr:uncharacterized protein C9374_006457 [Naegleria lovaniensis]KAG2381468.1 hypothetical protein C9374_006457 [Naegleria lovaniensis]